ncbi:hypothetical protein [Sorangium sp. So ce341]|uniref:hypothetical protein n=1 Tax=Sorangium sp. So ce341 TaxID=3133302 RepID=UPI003F600B65
MNSKAHPRLWIALLFASILCATLQGCSRTNKTAPSRHVWVELSSRRLTRAVESLERARINPESRARMEVYRARIDDAKRIRDELAAAPEGRADELAAAERRLKELTREAEEHALRGSVQSFALLAELTWELEHMKELARRTGRPADVVPENLFTLLSEPILRELHDRWSDGLEELQKAAASAPPGTYQRRIEETQAKLLKIKQALETPGVDLVARFFHADRRPDIDPHPDQWLAERESSRAKEIHERTISLLSIENARDGTDVAVLLELRRLVDSGPEGAVASRRALAMKRARGFHLPSSSQAVRDILHNRFADPLEAVRAEAALMLQWQELASIEPARRHVFLPDALASFPDWMVSHLSDEDLLEVKAYLDEARAALRATDLAIPLFLQGRLDVDRRVVELEAAAIARELEHRQTVGRPRAPPPPEDLSDAEKAMLARHSRPALPTLAGSRAEREALWEALRRYEARTNPKAEAKRLRIDLEIKGYQDELAKLVEDGKLIAKLTDAAARKRAEAIQAKRAERLRLGLSALSTSRPGEVQALLGQIDEVVPPGPSGRPAGFAAGVRAYGDFVLLQCTDELKLVHVPGSAPDPPWYYRDSSDLVELSALLAKRRQGASEHPLVKAVNEADKPHDDSAEDDVRSRSARDEGLGPISGKPSDPHEKTQRSSDGPTNSRPSGPRPGGKH